MRVRRTPVTAVDLAEALGVSQRSIYRDIETLRSLGAPIIGEAGVGYCLSKGFFLPEFAFSPDELDALALGLGWVQQRADPALAQSSESALAKISAAKSEGSATNVEWQYGTGADLDLLAPDGYELDIAYMARPSAEEIQLDLIFDYRSNVALYPDFQRYLRENRPPFLAAWGRHDPAFLPAGALAYKRDLPEAEVHLLDTGHFALETHHAAIAGLIRSFMSRHGLGAVNPTRK